MKTTLFLLLVSVLCFTMAACATPAETTAAIAAVGGVAVAFIDQLAPVLSPELAAKLQATAHTIDGTVQATAMAVGTLADAIGQMKTGVSAQMAEHAAGLAKATTALASLPSREEVLLTNTGTGVLATAASRGLSALKHSRAAVRTVAAQRVAATGNLPT